MSRFISTLVFILLLCPGAVPAGNAPSHLSFSIGPQVYHHEYTEPGVMENQGYFAGVAYALTWEKGGFARLDGAVSFGRVDYASPYSGVIDGKDNLCADTRLLLGYPVLDNGRVTLTPYTGIACRYLSDDGENQYSNTGHWAYLRKSAYLYSPIGLMAAVPLKKGWTLRPSVEYDLFWDGTQNSYLGYQPGYENIENDQDDGFGFRAILGLERQMNGYTLGIEAFYRYWDIDRSDICRDGLGRGWVEPANETREIGVGVLFRF